MEGRRRPAAIAIATWLLSWALAAPARAQIDFMKSRRDRQIDALRRWRPAAIRLRGRAPDPSGEVRVIRVRVHAAVDYRTQVTAWRTRFADVLARTSRDTAAWPGVRFEVKEVRPWARATTNVPLAVLLDELAAVDAGEDVDLVVGLASGLEIVPSSIHELGRAAFPGRHIVMRNLTSPDEPRALARTFDELGPAELEPVLAERTAHREEAILLHEWGHTLGGEVAARRGRRPDAERHLLRAIAIAPSLESAWEALGDLYRGGDPAALARLKQRHLAERRTPLR